MLQLVFRPMLSFYNKSWYLKCQYALTVTVNLANNGSVGDDSLSESCTGIITIRDIQ